MFGSDAAAIAFLLVLLIALIIVFGPVIDRLRKK